MNANNDYGSGKYDLFGDVNKLKIKAEELMESISQSGQKTMDELLELRLQNINNPEIVEQIDNLLNRQRKLRIEKEIIKKKMEEI